MLIYTQPAFINLAIPHFTILNLEDGNRIILHNICVIRLPCRTVSQHRERWLKQKHFDFIVGKGSIRILDATQTVVDGDFHRFPQCLHASGGII
jgi:hypothetical protein